MHAYWILSAIIFLSFTASGATNPFYALYGISLGATLGQIALVVGVQSATAVLAGLFWGPLADRVGRRRPFIIGSMGTLAVTQFAIANASSWIWLIPIHAIIGVAMGAFQVTSLALMGDILHEHPNRGRLVSAYRMSGSLAFSVAIVASGWISESVGLHGSFLLAAGVFALAFVFALLIPEPARREHTTTPSNFMGLLRGPMLPLLILAMSFGIPFSAVFSVWPVWIVNDLGIPRSTFSQLWGIASFVEIPFMLLAGIMVDRIGRRPTFVAGLGGFALLYLTYALEPSFHGLVAAQILRGFAFAAFTATALTMAIDLAPPEARGRAASLYTMAQGLAQISGNWVGGPLASFVGFQALFTLSAMTVFLGACYSYIVLPRKSR